MDINIETKKSDVDVKALFSAYLPPAKCISLHIGELSVQMSAEDAHRIIDQLTRAIVNFEKYIK